MPRPERIDSGAPDCHETIDEIVARAEVVDVTKEKRRYTIHKMPPEEPTSRTLELLRANVSDESDTD